MTKKNKGAIGMSQKKNEKHTLEEIESMKEKLTKLFHEMLTYKKKEYGENLSFEELMRLTAIHYNYRSYLFEDAYHAVKFGEAFVLPSEADNPFRNPDEDLSLSPEQILETLAVLYDDLTEKGNDYKKHAKDDVDIDLSGGKTLEELAKEYKEHFVPLFQEMLDLEKVPYDAKKNNSFSTLYLKVIDAYPWYHDLLFHLNYQISSSLDSSYVDMINACALGLKRLQGYQKERETFYQEHADVIEAHKKWLKKKAQVEKFNQQVEKEREPYARKLHGLYKDYRKAKRVRNKKDMRKYMQQIEEIEKMLCDNYPFQTIDSDPYNEIKYQNCFDDFVDLEEGEPTP